MSHQQMVKLRIIGRNALGELVMTLPLLKALRNKFPGCSIDLRLHTGLVDFAKPLADTVANYKEPLTPADMTINLMPGAKWHGTGATIHLMPFAEQFLNIPSWLLSAAWMLGIENADPIPTWPYPRTGNGAGPWVVRAEGPWEIPHLLRLLNQLPQKPIIVGSLKESFMVKQVAKSYDYPTMIGRPLSELVPVIQNAQGYLGWYSGLTHLAAALGTPTTAIFMPTETERRWYPLNPNAKVIHELEQWSPVGK